MNSSYFAKPIKRYPLLFKRGRMRMAPPPVEVQKVEQILFDDPSKSSDYKFHLVPSKAAIKDAESLDLPLNGDIPLFVADRLAFASDEGPQVCFLLCFVLF